MGWWLCGCSIIATFENVGFTFFFHRDDLIANLLFNVSYSPNITIRRRSPRGSVRGYPQGYLKETREMPVGKGWLGGLVGWWGVGGWVGGWVCL